MSAEIPEVGWSVVDPDGNVVHSGGVTFAEMTAESAQALAEFLTQHTNQEG